MASYQKVVKQKFEINHLFYANVSSSHISTYHKEYQGVKVPLDQCKSPILCNFCAFYGQDSNLSGNSCQMRLKL
jgi:hypothetical protein